MFAAGSPTFGIVGACYHYNPRHGQSISVPKIWKCLHRRSVPPEEGKLESRSTYLQETRDKFLLEIKVSFKMLRRDIFHGYFSLFWMNYASFKYIFYLFNKWLICSVLKAELEILGLTQDICSSVLL